MLGNGIDADRDLLAGLEPRELRLFEIRFDVDIVERHEAREPLPGLHEIAGLDCAIADHAGNRCTDFRERQIALGLRQCGLQFLDRARRLLLLRLQHRDRSLGGIEAGLCALHARDGLVAVGLRLFEGLPAGEFTRCQRLLAIQFELRAPGGHLRGNELRLRLLDRRPLRLDLAADAVDRSLLGRDLVARRVNREPVVAVVDGGDQVAGMHIGVVLDQDARNVAGDLGGQRGVVGTHIGVVGRDGEAADRPPAIAECAGRSDGEHQHGGEDRELAAIAIAHRLRGFRAWLSGKLDHLGRCPRNEFTALPRS